jgi:hypothetical protein
VTKYTCTRDGRRPKLTAGRPDSHARTPPWSAGAALAPVRAQGKTCTHGARGVAAETLAYARSSAVAGARLRRRPHRSVPREKQNPARHIPCAAPHHLAGGSLGGPCWPGPCMARGAPSGRLNSSAARHAPSASISHRPGARRAQPRRAGRGLQSLPSRVPLTAVLGHCPSRPPRGKNVRGRFLPSSARAVTRAVPGRVPSGFALGAKITRPPTALLFRSPVPGRLRLPAPRLHRSGKRSRAMAGFRN